MTYMMYDNDKMSLENDSPSRGRKPLRAVALAADAAVVFRK